MAWAAIVTGVVSVGTAAYQASKQKKAAKAAEEAAAAAGEAGQIDIGELDKQVRDISTRNAIDSRKLERQLTPEVSSLRTASTSSLMKDLLPTEQQGQLNAGLMSDFNNGLTLPELQRSGLLGDAIAKTRADLALGGNLDIDTQNAVTRNALARAGSVQGGTGLNLGRDITARDLGLSSLDIANTRLGNAVNVGKIDQDLNLTQQQMQGEIDKTNRSGRVGLASLLTDLGNQDFQKRLAISQFTQGINQPQVGLDPGSIAALVSGNKATTVGAMQQQAAIAQGAANNQAQLYGQAAGAIGGIAGSALSSYRKQPTVNTTSNPYLYGTNPTFNTTLKY